MVSLRGFAKFLFKEVVGFRRVLSLSVPSHDAKRAALERIRRLEWEVRLLDTHLSLIRQRKGNQ